MKKREKLINGLKITINALEKDIVHYDWHTQASCNCGIVAQVMLNKSATEIEQMETEQIIFAPEIYSRLGLTNSTGKGFPSWKNAVKVFCPITGSPLKQIFKDLEEAGLSKEDIVHLEFMDNLAILKRSGIETEIKHLQKVRVGKEQRLKSTFLGYKKYEYVDVFENKETKIPDSSFFKKKDNLIKYLKAWVSILEEESKITTSSSTLEELKAEELKAVTDNNYELAAQIRDQILQHV